jgi:NitT/TauT family transport system permease protein
VNAPEWFPAGVFFLDHRMSEIMDRDQSKRNHRQNQQSRIINMVYVILSIAFALSLWFVITTCFEVPEFFLPSPQTVWERFIESVRAGILAKHTLSTFSEVMGGLVMGILVAAVLGYTLAKSRTVERLLAPYIVASQSIPIVAIAPLLVIWFGSGRLSKVLISALIVFFPILVNTIVAVRSVPEDLRDLMRSLQATQWQVFSKLELPAAMPVLLGGLKIGATLSVIGAVVGEFVAADEGLGFLINLARGMYDTPMVFVAVLTLIGMALLLYSLVAVLEIKLLYWREDPSKS